MRLRALVAASATLIAAGCGGGTSSAPASTASGTATAAASTPAMPPGSPTSPATRPPGATPSAKVVETLATGLDVPWGLALLPGGDLLFSTRDDGVIHRVEVTTGRTRTAGHVPSSTNVASGGEGGLLGLAVAPTYASDHRVYAYYSTAHDNRIAWSTDLEQWHPIVTGIPHGVHHNGGRLAFDGEGLLYAGTGESGNTSLSQDRSSLGGKILRMTPEGKAAPGNPFPGSLVWSYGHRNVQGLAFDAAGRLWASEFGDRTADELNWIRPGRNYGWPDTQGTTDDTRFTSPAAQWGTEEDSPSGIAIASGAVWMAALRGERLWRIPLRGTAAGRPTSFLDGRYGRLRSVLALDDHTLVLTTSNHDGRGATRDGDDKLLLVKVS